MAEGLIKKLRELGNGAASLHRFVEEAFEVVKKSSFEDLAKSALELIFWLSLLLPMFIFPILFIALPYLPMPMIDGRALTPNELFIMLLNPFASGPLIGALMQRYFFEIVASTGLLLFTIIMVMLLYVRKKLLPKVRPSTAMKPAEKR